VIPVAIAVAGFANWWVGFVFFLVALFQIGWRVVESFGSPEKWVPGYKERREKELRERHYVYHCEQNPDGFARLMAENLEKEYSEN
jgi:membrane protein implicated in regulation of membrane protease activity